MKKNLLFAVLLLEGITLTGCSLNKEMQTERLYNQAMEYVEDYNFTEEEAEINKKLTYCNAYALAHSFYITDNDNYYSLAKKTMYYKMADTEKFNKIITIKDNCYDSFNITADDVAKVTKKQEARIEQLRKEIK